MSTRQARTPAARKAAAPGPTAPFAPMSFTTRDPEAEAERIPLFEVDGTAYTVPAEVPPTVGIKLMLMTAGMSEARRGAVLIENLAGNKALNALLNSGMSDAEWHQLITTLSEHAYGRLEEPGN